jgi:PAS domain S-box-containing protein
MRASIRTKLLAAFGLMVALISVVGMFAVAQIGRDQLLILLVIASLAVSTGVAVIIIRRIIRAADRIGAAANAIAHGDIAQYVEVSAGDELGTLATDFGRMVDYLTSVTAVAQAIAGGDLSVDVRPRSDRDVLGRSLAAMTESLRLAMREKERLIEQIAGVVVVFDAFADDSLKFTFVSRQSETILGVAPSELLQDAGRFFSRVHEDDRAAVLTAALEPRDTDGVPPLVAFRFVRPDRREVWLHVEAAVVSREDCLRRIQAVLFDVTAAKQAELERERLELDLRLSQKLEAVGQLAAGIAHEINTPIQFIGDSVAFLEQAATDLIALTAMYRELLECEEIERSERQRMALAAEEDCDLEYLIERVPGACSRALDGIERVSTIVRAMRQFGHPSTQRSPTDVNEALQTTLIVSRNEYRYVADVGLDLGELPPVMANASDLNQVFLNLIVNAAHAIQSRQQDSGRRGMITICTRDESAGVVISIGDTGCGIDPEIAERVFDPFFTTKPVGQGMGLGLDIVRRLVRHNDGEISVESQPGRTEFRVVLPLAETDSAPGTS